MSRPEEQESKLSHFDEKHRENYLKYRSILNEIHDFDVWAVKFPHLNLKLLKDRAQKRLDDFKHEHGHRFDAVTQTPAWWVCMKPECQNHGTMSAGQREGSVMFCKTHFNG